MYNENQPFSFGSESENINNPVNSIFNYADNTDAESNVNVGFNPTNFEQQVVTNNNVFDTEVSVEQSQGFDNPILENTTNVMEASDDTNEQVIQQPLEEMPVANNEQVSDMQPVEITEPVVEMPEVVSELEETPTSAFDSFKAEDVPVQEELTQIELEPIPETPVTSFEAVESTETPAALVPEEKAEDVVVSEQDTEPKEVEPEEQKIEMSDTPIEEIEKLTQYEPDNMETTDINALFDRVSINFKDASDIFKRNTEMYQKIDSKFSELKTLQAELDSQKQNQMNEVNAYKDEVFSKLTEKKEEIEKRLEMLKEMQSNFEKERDDFEKYRTEELDNIESIKREVQEAYDSRREELNHVEDVLRKQKDELDAERNQLSLDKIEYESNKNELANNLLKFNELVDSFTSGVDNISGNKE